MNPSHGHKRLRRMSFISEMNILTRMLRLGLESSPPNTVLEDEIVMLTSEDIEKKRSPFFYAVHRLGDTGVSIDFALAGSAATVTGIGPFQLCVFAQPIDFAAMPDKLTQVVDHIRRHEVVAADRATFDLANEELPHTALVVYRVARSEGRKRFVRGYCVAMADLLKTVQMTRRIPLLEHKASSAG